MEARKIKTLRTIPLLLIVLLFCPFTYSKVIYVDDDATGANNGSSWTDAFPCLQGALTIARPGDEIRVGQGTYQPDRKITGRSLQLVASGDRTESFQLRNGVALKGGYAGVGELNPNMRDIELYETILSGDLNRDDVEVADPSDLLDEPTRIDNSYLVVTTEEIGEAIVFDGFTISGGNSRATGGGIHCRRCPATISNNRIISNSAIEGGGGIVSGLNTVIVNNIITGNSAGPEKGGGGIYCGAGALSPMIANNIISRNFSQKWGGGISCHKASPTLINNLIVFNYANYGGGIENHIDCHPIIINCTLSRNHAYRSGGCIYNDETSTSNLLNCILWDNSFQEIIGNTTISYSNVQGGFSGEGNINADPMFVDAADGDCYLRDGSPCIDAGIMVAGVPNTDIEGNPRPNPQGSRPDMGAYEHGPQSWRWKARNPSPPHGVATRQKNPVISWTPGEKAIEHDVYFGTDFEDVNSADIFDISGIYRGRWIDPNYVTEELNLDQTYYWRIDEINDLEPDSPWKGGIWSFTVTDKATLEFQVSSSNDDVYATDNTLLSLDADYLKIGSSSFAKPPYYMSGMVFRNINVPQGIEIVEAHLRIQSYNNRLTGNVYGKIEAEATDDADAFGGSRHIGSLLITEASVDWNHEEPWAEDTWYDSTDIAAVIQEVINREGWSPGNSLAILYSTWAEGDYRNFSSYDRGSDYAPKLVIIYIPD